ncbi:MAG: DNA-directed RNA polymerase subunit omega [Armatimonadetes bacterium RBG_16_58_9]|nr:MAG: DNA-directed RNA polymerase subunit omega [Armatimonadetes bacterium RBG_16_58_9]
MYGARKRTVVVSLGNNFIGARWRRKLIMIYPSADKLEKWGNKYSLVVLAAKRAKQLKSGAPVLIDTDSDNPLTVALEEIASGKVLSRVPDTDALPTEKAEPEVAQLLAVPEDRAETDAEALEVEATEAATVEQEEIEIVLESEEEETTEVEIAGEMSEETDVVDSEADLEDFEESEELEETQEDTGEVEIEVADEEPVPRPKRGRKAKAEEPE